MAITEEGAKARLESIQRDHPKPRPLGSLIAAAQRLNSRTIRSAGKATAQDWQADAWDLYDLVGEQHYLASTLSNRLGQARLYAGILPDDPTQVPEPVEDGRAAEVFAAFGGSHGAQSQLVARLGVNLFVAGDGWFVGIPRALLPASQSGVRPDQDTEDGIAPTGYGPDGEPLLDLDDLEWRMLSVSEVSFDQSRVTLQLGEAKEDKLVVAPDDVFLVRVWRPHPRKWWQADSPTRASLPVLRELVGLTEHVSAQVDSRLAGAGVFVVPQTAKDALLNRVGQPEDDEDDADPFTEALIEAMITPIKDRSNASAFVPLVITVPDDATDKFHHISFASQLDAESRNLRDEAIRRLALSQDAPPEVLLGMGDGSHWNAWLVNESTITTHVEPPLALICDALTTQFLRPVLIQQGMEPDEADRYVVWYDVSQLVQRPNRTADAATLYAAGVISADTYRETAGFGDADKPETSDPAVQLVLDLVKGAPSLAQDPGVGPLVEQIRAVLAGDTAPAPTAEPTADDGAGEVDQPSNTINDVEPPEENLDPGPDNPAEESPPGLAASISVEPVLSGWR